MNFKSIIFVLIINLCLIGVGAKYGYMHNNVKFIPITTPAGKTYINVLSIVSVSKTWIPQREGMTEISVINGETYYTKDSVDMILERIIEF